MLMDIGIKIEGRTDSTLHLIT